MYVSKHRQPEHKRKVVTGTSANEVLSVLNKVSLPGGNSTVSIYMVPSSHAHMMHQQFIVNHCV